MADLRAPLERLIETWRKRGNPMLAPEAFSESWKSPWARCADELAALLALPAETPAPYTCPQCGVVAPCFIHSSAAKLEPLFLPTAGETPAPVTPPADLPKSKPFCRKHRIYKLAVAHYYCEECAAAGEAMVGPASAHEAKGPETPEMIHKPKLSVVPSLDIDPETPADPPPTPSEKGTPT